jgi:3-oxoacyl-[acyl-carrier-protein] synthase-3
MACARATKTPVSPSKMRILSTGSYVPPKIVTNEELELTVPTKAAWIHENLGIKERRVSDDEVYTSDLAAEAARRALESADIDPESLDLILLATATPDRKAPSTACLVKHKLGLESTFPALDIAAVCSGFLYGLSIASNLMKGGSYRRVLVIGADTFSKITNWNSRDCVFFGDGAGAAVVEACDDPEALFDSRLYSDTRETDNFTVYPSDRFFTMNGRAVYETGARVLPEAILALLEKNALRIEDVRWIIPHQPSHLLLRETAKRLNFPFERVRRNMDRYANTSAATIPLLFDEVRRSGDLERGDLVVFAAVGSGWAWGAAVYRWM